MLKHLIPAALLAWPAFAADTPTALETWLLDRSRVFDATEVDLTEFQWAARPIVVFANSPLDPAFQEQMEEMESELDRLIERDVVLIVDTDPSAESAIRMKLRPRSFMMVLIGKDGQISLRKPLPWTVREISRSIDKMPMRQREMQENPSGEE